MTRARQDMAELQGRLLGATSASEGRNAFPSRASRSPGIWLDAKQSIARPQLAQQCSRRLPCPCLQQSGARWPGAWSGPTQPVHRPGHRLSPLPQSLPPADPGTATRPQSSLCHDGLGLLAKRTGMLRQKQEGLCQLMRLNAQLQDSKWAAAHALLRCQSAIALAGAYGVAVHTWAEPAGLTELPASGSESLGLPACNIWRVGSACFT